MRKLFYILLLVILTLAMASCAEKTTKVLQQVETPVFDLPSGIFTEVDTFTITCPTEGAVIYYTFEGLTPDVDSSIFQDPIAITKTILVKARAFKEGFTPSDIAIARYTFQPGTIQLLNLAGGTFTMGRTKGEGNTDERPTHSVTVSPFSITPYEITQENIAKILGYTNIVPTSITDENYQMPAYSMSWYSTLVYCNLLSMAENKTPVYTIKGTTDPDAWGNVPTYFDADWDAVIADWNANGYRLPTEAEWEYAARGGTNTPDYIFAGSDSIQTIGWSTENSGGVVHIVGEKAANGLGLYDMSGNIWEWCWDKMDSLYYASSPASNPQGPVNGSWRVLRGGSYISATTNCRVAERDFDVPYYKNDVTGFRVVRKN